MLSLTVLVAAMVISLTVSCWAAAWAARAVGSSRGRWSIALLAAILTSIANGALLFLARPPRVLDANMILALGILVLAVAIFLDVFIYSKVFRLTFAAAIAPFAASIAVSGIFIAIVVFTIKPYAVEGFVMPTRSMAPTVEPGDRFMVNKRLQPRRWDLVTYRQASNGQTEIYCKRLVGLPGERIRFENGKIYVNDQPADVPAVLAGRCHASLPHLPNSTRYQDGQTITLGSREYFFIGDNIDISGDSRIYGPSDTASIVGVVDCMYWPVKKWHIFR